MNKNALSRDTSPEEIEALFNEACLLHKKGELDQAVKKYRNLLQILPGFPLLHFNCGLALYEQEYYKEAEKHYKEAATLSPDDPDIHYNRGLNFRRQKRNQAAARSFEKAFKLGDHNLDTLYNLASCYQDLQEFSQASLLYDAILAREPKHLSALNNYAYLCHKSGEIQKAEELYRRVLELKPEHKGARHMLNSLSGETVEAAPLEYVEAVFDNYATTFEHSLVEHLGYKTPETLRKRYQELFQGDRRTLCLDLGCGTGLAGQQFHRFCEGMIGVDISTKMLDKAREKGVYQELVKSDISAYLTRNAPMADLILAADVFTYMGDLENVFRECFNKTVEGGLFLFSVEDGQEYPFLLKETGRFGHAPRYISELCEKTGWKMRDHHPSKLRQEKEDWIQGHLYILEK